MKVGGGVRVGVDVVVGVGVSVGVAVGGSGVSVGIAVSVGVLVGEAAMIGALVGMVVAVTRATCCWGVVVHEPSRVPKRQMKGIKPPLILSPPTLRPTVVWCPRSTEPVTARAVSSAHLRVRQIESALARAILSDPLDQYSLYLIQAEGISGAVIQLGRARRLVVRDPCSG